MKMTEEMYRIDRDGNKIATKNIRPQELLEDQLVQALAEQAEKLSLTLAEYKAHAFTEVLTLRDVLRENYQAKRGGKKGNMTLYTFDGSYKVEMAHADRIEFGPDLEVARALIGEYLDSVTTGAGDELRTLISSVFRVGEDRSAKVGDVLSLLRWDIQHPKWVDAMAAIRNSIRVYDRASYIRVYRRDDAGAYHAIPLDLAKVPVASATHYTTTPEA